MTYFALVRLVNAFRVVDGVIASVPKRADILLSCLTGINGRTKHKSEHVESDEVESVFFYREYVVCVSHRVQSVRCKWLLSGRHVY